MKRAFLANTAVLLAAAFVPAASAQAEVAPPDQPDEASDARRLPPDPSPTVRGSARRDLRDVLGVAHVDGKYHLTGKEFLIEGAEQISALGVRVIKLYLTVPPRQYPYNTEWPEAKTLVDVARTPPYRAVLAMPFSTHILTAYAAGRPEHYWRKGVSDDEARDETEQFYQLARYLLGEYRGSGKTFVLQHWEGDWALRGSYDPEAEPSETAVAGMVRWLNARQRGVEKARAEARQDHVRVFHAAEVNLVRIAMRHERPTVANRVLPHARVDLVSYSAWDTQEDPQELRRALDYIAQRALDRPPFGNRNVYVGEFGLPENERPPEQVRRVVGGVVETALDWGCPFVVYWQVYCNEARRQPVRDNDDVRGFWLIRPDGSKSHAWHELGRRLAAQTGQDTRRGRLQGPLFDLANDGRSSVQSTALPLVVPKCQTD